MTSQRAKELLPIITAFAEGKTIQTSYNPNESDWSDLTDKSDVEFSNDLHYRIKPTPTLRPWRPEEVPVGALLRHRTVTFMHSPVTMILSVRGDWIGFVCAETFKLTDMLCENINKSYEHSLDHGKTWLPCGVMADE